MVETITATGIVISSMAISEYDKRLVILTSELGKITAFARGARRTNSQYLAGSQPMAFGEFTLYRGRNSYTLTGIKIKKYFSNDIKDIDRMYMGMYFLELSDYYGREGIGAGETIKLLGNALNNLTKDRMPVDLIRCIVELKTLVINGDFPDMFSCCVCGKKEGLDYFDIKKLGLVCNNCHGKIPADKRLINSTLYALQFIVVTKVEKLFTFNVTGEVLTQLKQVIGGYIKKHIDKKFNSLEFLEFDIEIK